MPFITLTGADDSTPHDSLWHLAENCHIGDFKHGNVEWGILYSASNQGTGRYPSFRWIEEIAETIKASSAGPSFALHVCGRAVHDFLAGRGHVSEVATAFHRIQVNFRSTEFEVHEIQACLRRNPFKTIITQHNDANRDLWQALKGIDNHAVLFDKSGGRGQSPDSWAAPLPGVACGYAGGLGPDNLAVELPRVHAVANGLPFWTDMEGKLRDENDRFDLGRARQCLEIAGQFYREQVVASAFAKPSQPLRTEAL